MAARIALMLPKLSAYGGAERFGLGLARALAENGYAVDFICARQEVPAPPGVTARVVGRPGPFKVVKMLWFAWAAKKARAVGDYDLVIGLGKTLDQDVLRISGGPLRNFWRLSKRAYAPGLARAWKMLRRRLSPANRLTLAIEPRQLRRAKVVVAVSHLVRDWLLDAYPWLDPARIRLIYNRPDPTRFFPLSGEERAAERERLGLAPGHKAVLTAGTNFRLKNVASCIRALGLLPPEYLLLVAGGRGHQSLDRLARDLGVSGRVRFLGRIADMRSLYGASDAFVLPTFYDACSNAVLEALACGLPAISSRDNGSSHFLPENRVLKDPADVKTMAGMIRDAAEGPLPEALEAPPDAAWGMDAWLALVRELLDAD